MADGTDEEAAHAARMGEWIVWETRRGLEECGEGYFVARLLLFLLSFVLLYGGTPAPESCAQRTVEGDGFPLL